MAILDNPEDFTSGENVTAAKLNNLVNGATFLGGAGEATDGSTLEVNDGEGGDGSLRVKDLGITTAKLADGAVSTQKIADSAVTSGKIADGAIIASKIAPSASSAIMPPGGVLPYAGATSPTGWLLCSGQTIGDVGSGADFESADYETLFGLIKSHYGNAGTEVWASGDTVLLPDLRGRVIAGQDDMGGSSADTLTDAQADQLGGILGEEDHTLTVNEIPSHRHPPHENITGITGGFVYNTSAGSGAGNGGGFEYEADTGLAGGGGSHNNVQPTIILNYIIKY
jgi:microcystin-dependent protein